MDAILNFFGGTMELVMAVVVTVFLLAVGYRILKQKWPGFIQKLLDKGK